MLVGLRRSFSSSAPIVHAPAPVDRRAHAWRGQIARSTSAGPRQRKRPVAANIISSDVVAASTETRHRLIDGTSGPAANAPTISDSHTGVVRNAPAVSVARVFSPVIDLANAAA